MYWHQLVGTQNGTATGQATLDVSYWHPITQVSFYNLWMAVGGKSCYWTIGTPVVQGNFVVMHGTPVAITHYDPALRLLSNPITLVVYNLPPYIAVASGADVMFFGTP